MSKKVFLDNLGGTVFILCFGLLLSYLLGSIFDRFEKFNPISQMFDDFELTDMAWSEEVDAVESSLDTNIILVNIGRNRAEIAQELFALNRLGPKVIGIDAFFNSRKQDTMADVMLSMAMKGVQNLVLVSELKGYDSDENKYDTVTSTTPFFSSLANFGFANMQLTESHVGRTDFRAVREFYPYYNLKSDSIVPNFSVKVASIFDSTILEDLQKRSLESEVINFKGDIYGGEGRQKRFLSFDYEEIVEGQIDPAIIKDKIVLVGLISSNPHTNLKDEVPYIYGEDKFYTPRNENYVGKAYPDMFGVVVHANVIATILDRNYIDKSPIWLEYAMAFILMFLNVSFFAFIYRDHGDLYDITTKTIQIFELLLFSALMVFSITMFQTKINLSYALIGIALAGDLLEIYQGGFKIGYRYLRQKFLTSKKSETP